MATSRGHQDDWKFVLGVRIPPRALQLVVVISDHPQDPGKQRLYFYFAVMCAPITTRMLRESEDLQEWCNERPDMDAADDKRTFTWSADGFYTKAPSASCVIWTHVSLVQCSVPKAQARQAAARIGAQLAKIMGNACGNESIVELLFAVREGKWVHDGAIGYARAVGAMQNLAKASQSIILLNQQAYALSDFEYTNRPPHVSVLDLLALQNFGSLLFYTYRSHEDATDDNGLTTLFFAEQARAVQNYEGSNYWMQLDLDSFLRYMHGHEHGEALRTPRKLGVFEAHCGPSAKRSGKKPRTSARKIKRLSRKMSKLAVR